MKAAMLNLTGNVGKTTLATNLLKPRMGDATLISVETINQSADSLGIAIDKMSGDQFRKIYSTILKVEDVIVDVGTSNIEAFIDGLAKFEDSSLEFDLFLVPVTSGTKEQLETIQMFKTLKNFGVDTSRIKVLFNRVRSDVHLEFEVLAKYAATDPDFPFDPNLAVIETELFSLLGQKRTSIEAILADATDYRTAMKDLPQPRNQDQLDRLADAMAIRSLAKTVKKDLDSVYARLLASK